MLNEFFKNIVNFLTAVNIDGKTNINNSLTVSSTLEVQPNNPHTTLYVTDSLVGINTEFPNVSFTVNGKISSNEIIYDKDGNSTQWNSGFTIIKNLSANWNSVYTSVKDTSANWDSVYSSVLNTSGNWDSVYSSVKDTSANWNSVYSSVKDTSANWDSVYSSVLNTSGNWDSVYSSVKDTSANWDSVYSSVLNTSGNWDSVYSSVKDTSGNWDSVYSTYNKNSSEYTKYDYVNNNFLPLSGGTVFGPVYMLSSLQAGTGNFTLDVKENSVSIYGILSSNSTIYANNGNSNLWNSSYTSVLNTSANWDSTFTSVKNTSANWDSVYTSVKDTSGNWDSVYSTYNKNSSEYTKYDYVNNNFLPLSGGTVTGITQFNNNVTIWGVLSATGGTYFANTIYSTTSAISVVHVGSGPAMFIGSTGTGDIASFYDLDQNIEMLHIGGHDGAYPHVGIKTSTPNVDFTVNGEISSNNIIYDRDGNSTQWNSSYTSVKDTSGNWNSVYTSVKDTSANWDSVYSSVKDTSANWDSVYSSVLNTSGNWDSVYSSVLNTSGNWDSVYSSVLNTSGNWDSVYSSVKDTSGNWDSVYSSVLNTSGNWDSVYSSVLNTSGNWDSVYSSVLNTSGNWDSVYSSVLNTSGNWDSVYSSVKDTSGNWDSVYSSVLNTSGNWNSVYTSVKDTSGNWDSVYSSVLNTSGNWDSVYSSVKDTSANWNSVYSTVKNASAAFGSMTNALTSDLNVGAITAGQVFDIGTTFQAFAEKLITKVFYPTFTLPSATLTSNLASIVESGTTGITLTVNLNKGLITGKSLNGIWQPTLFQNNRSGDATKYTIFGIDNGTTTAYTSANAVVIDGTNTFTATVDYATGPQPVDSKNNNFDSPLVLGSISPSLNITGRRRAFYGINNAGLTSNNIRNLQNSLLNPSNGSKFTINIPIGTTSVLFAYPASLRDVDYVEYVQGLGSDVKGNFTKTTFDVEGLNSYTGTQYKVYRYAPTGIGGVPIPFTETVDYIVTI